MNSGINYYPQTNEYNSGYQNSFYNPTILQTQIPTLDQMIVPVVLLPFLLSGASQNVYSNYFQQNPTLGKQLSAFIQQCKQALQYNATGKQMGSFRVPWAVESGETVYLNGSQLVGFYYTIFANQPNASYMGLVIYRYLQYMNEQTRMRALVQNGTPYYGDYIGNNYNKSFGFY